ncbi:hypothetical protein [Kitasatospora sp. NPDC005856]|uniref:hypothetical protein n=1 Tax=Kitasatospora sp. NPDC005856 TaxID=3154566 RepID=UPI0033F62FAC
MPGLTPKSRAIEVIGWAERAVERIGASLAPPRPARRPDPPGKNTPTGPARVRNPCDRARAELGRLVRPLDAALHDRTLPDPFAHRRGWRTEFWWYRRLADPAWQ